MLNNNRDILNLKIISTFILFSFLLISSFIAIDKLYLMKQTEKTTHDMLQKKIIERELFFKNFLDDATNNLQAIRTSKSFDKYLNNQESDIYDLFMTVASADHSMMQLRYIDKDGFEQIRIDRKKDADTPFIVSNEKLQDKSDRPYFFLSKEKPLETIWFSSLDLNVENHKIEIPFKPTLRAILPIQHNGQFHGILIINYFMENFITKLFNTPFNSMILANNKGAILKHFDDTKSWGSHKEPKYTLQNEFPNFSSDILNNDQFSHKDFESKKLSLPVDGGLILIMQLSDQYVQEQQDGEIRKYLIDFLVVLSFGILISIFLSSIIKKLYNNYFEIKTQLRDANQLTIKQSKILLQQKEEFETIFNQVKDGIAIVDLDTNFLNFNDAYLTMTGFTREELLTKSCIGLSASQDKERSKEIMEEVLKKGFITNYEKSCIVKDGKMITVNMAITLMPDKQRFLISTKNITDIKFLESQLKLISMGEMIGNIAHQWRQPLSVISTIASGIAFKQEYEQLDTKEIIPNMETIVKQATYLSKTIDDFKNFIKSSDDESTIDVNSLIDKTLSIVNPTLKSGYITTILDIDENLKVIGFENELIQGFINIINNSKDAMNDNISLENEKYLFISAHQIEDSVEISFKDNGGGINPQIINRIFEPYFTTKHQSVGTGLGLSMTYKIITERHLGKLGATNTTYKYNGKNYTGALFTISLHTQNSSTTMN